MPGEASELQECVEFAKSLNSFYHRFDHYNFSQLLILSVGIVALWSLAILAFERFFVICRPLKNVRLGGHHAALGILFVWTFSFIWTIPPVLGWNYHDHTYIITFFSTCFILPLGVIIGSYAKLMQKLRKVSNAHGRLGNTRKPDGEVARMVIVMIIAFMVGWTPYAAFSITVTAYPTIHMDPRLAAVPAFFSKTAAVYNPIIYVFMNKQMFKGNSATLESTLRQTSDRGATAESHMGEMSTIAARIPLSSCAEESPLSSCADERPAQDTREYSLTTTLSRQTEKLQDPRLSSERARAGHLHPASQRAAINPVMGQSGE
ncbi:hypothetical protein JZ751_007515, partial [Albula glossodonta]